MKVEVSNIDWDTDSDVEDIYPDLPETIVVDVESEDEAIDVATDETGFCINSASIKILT